MPWRKSAYTQCRVDQWCSCSRETRLDGGAGVLGHATNAARVVEPDAYGIGGDGLGGIGLRGRRGWRGEECTPISNQTGTEIGLGT